MLIRVILIDDHEIMLDALSTFLDKVQGIKVVGKTTDVCAVQELVASLQPDALVMDICMPDMNGIELTRRLLAQYPKLKIVALSAYAQKQYVLEMFEAGASAYIIKNNAGSELIRALQAVVEGHKYLCPEVAAAVVDNTGHYPMPVVYQLGPREREVLQLLAEGGTSPEIGKRLFISTCTVDVHRRNIMKKLDLHNVAELTKYAVRNGLTGG
jgi:two-component system NarL family response regulator